MAEVCARQAADVPHGARGGDTRCVAGTVAGKGEEGREVSRRCRAPPISIEYRPLLWTNLRRACTGVRGAGRRGLVPQLNARGYFRVPHASFGGQTPARPLKPPGEDQVCGLGHQKGPRGVQSEPCIQRSVLIRTSESVSDSHECTRPQHLPSLGVLESEYTRVWSQRLGARTSPRLRRRGCPRPRWRRRRPSSRRPVPHGGRCEKRWRVTRRLKESA